MASLCMVLVGILYFSLCQCLLSSSTENIGDNLDWKVASRKILELEKLVKDQNDRISALEKRQRSRAEITDRIYTKTECPN